jgi:hypothetical protein
MDCTVLVQQFSFCAGSGAQVRDAAILVQSRQGRARRTTRR